MTANAGSVALSATRPSLVSRVYGFGSVYAKTLRDSRLTFLIMTGLTGGMALGVGAALGKDFASPGGRADLVALVNAMPPIVAGSPETRSTSGRWAGTCPGSTARSSH
jgi:hypothetical protein